MKKIYQNSVQKISKKYYDLYITFYIVLIIPINIFKYNGNYNQEFCELYVYYVRIYLQCQLKN